MTKQTIQIDFYWRCAPCGCVYLASEAVVKVQPYPACPNCGEPEDVFRGDDGCWDSDDSGVFDENGFVPSKGPDPWDWEGKKRGLPRRRAR